MDWFATLNLIEKLSGGQAGVMMLLLNQRASEAFTTTVLQPEGSPALFFPLNKSAVYPGQPEHNAATTRELLFVKNWPVTFYQGSKLILMQPFILAYFRVLNKHLMDDQKIKLPSDAEAVDELKDRLAKLKDKGKDLAAKMERTKQEADTFLSNQNKNKKTGE